MVVTAGAMLFVQFRRAQNINVEPNTLPLINTDFTEIPLTAEEKPFGNPGASLLIIGFFDFNETADRAAAQTIVKFAEANPQAVQFYIKHAPQTKLFGGDRTLPHRAIICADAQKKYREFLADMAETNKINTESLTKIASDNTLNTATWQNCLENPTTKQAITADMAFAQNLSVQTTPAIFVNNKKLNLDKNVDLNDLLNKFIET